MLHTKFKDNIPVDLEKIFFKIIGHLGNVIDTRYTLFFLPLNEGCLWNFIEIYQVVSEKKSFENVYVTFGQGHKVTWPLGGLKSTAFPYHRIQQQYNIHFFSFFSIQKPKGPTLALSYK